jgi:hypothetical protein
MCFVWISEQNPIISLCNINSWFLLTRSIVFTLHCKLNLFILLRLILDTVFTSALQYFKWSYFIFINWSLRNNDSLSLSIPHFMLIPSFLPSYLPSFLPSFLPSSPFLYFAFMQTGTTVTHWKKMATCLTPCCCVASPCWQADFFGHLLVAFPPDVSSRSQFVCSRFL